MVLWSVFLEILHALDKSQMLMIGIFQEKVTGSLRKLKPFLMRFSFGQLSHKTSSCWMKLTSKDLRVEKLAVNCNFHCTLQE